MILGDTADSKTSLFFQQRKEAVLQKRRLAARISRLERQMAHIGPVEQPELVPVEDLSCQVLASLGDLAVGKHAELMALRTQYQREKQRVLTLMKRLEVLETKVAEHREALRTHKKEARTLETSVQVAAKTSATPDEPTQEMLNRIAEAPKLEAYSEAATKALMQRARLRKDLAQAQQEYMIASEYLERLERKLDESVLRGASQ
jgi:hypothetical protein